MTKADVPARSLLPLVVRAGLSSRCLIKLSWATAGRWEEIVHPVVVDCESDYINSSQ